MKKSFFYAVIIIFFIVSFPAAYAQESYLVLNIQIFEDGSALIRGSASGNPDIKDIDFENNDVYGMTHQLTNKQGPIWNFNIGLREYSSLIIKVFLPEDTKIIGAVQSNTEAITSIENEKIALEFGVYNQEIDISFDYEFEDSSNEAKDFSWLLWMIVTAIILLTFWVILRKIKQKKAKKTKKKKKVISAFEKRLKVVKKTLNERENKIIEFLVGEKGKSTQGKLQKLSGIPKSSFSRHIAELERKDIIIKHGKGKLNLIELKK